MRSLFFRLAVAAALVGGAVAIARPFAGPRLRDDARLPAPLGPDEYRGPSVADVVGAQAIGDDE